MQNIITVAERHGLLIVFLNVLLSQGGLPLPVVPTLMTVAALARQSPYQITQIILAGVSGALMADAVLYWCGLHYGQRFLALLCRLSFSPDLLAADRLAEGEELGSNILHLGDNDPRSPHYRGERTSGQHAGLICRMSALHPIATELWHCNEMSRRANRRHMQCSKPQCYSITSSASAINLSGTVRPSALAVVRFITSANLTGAWAGS